MTQRFKQGDRVIFMRQHGTVTKAYNGGYDIMFDDGILGARFDEELAPEPVTTHSWTDENVQRLVRDARNVLGMHEESCHVPEYIFNLKDSLAPFTPDAELVEAMALAIAESDGTDTLGGMRSLLPSYANQMENAARAALAAYRKHTGEER